MSLSCPISAAATRAANAVFLEMGEARLTFKQCSERVQMTASAIRCGHSDVSRPLLIPVLKSPESLLTVLAAMRAGFIVVPFDPTLPKTRVAELCAELNLQLMDNSPPGVNQQQRRWSGGAPPWHAHSPALGIFTSGSSGIPKLVVHNWHSLLNNALASNKLIPLSTHSRTLLSLPLYHIGGLAQALRALLSHSTLVFGGVVEDSQNLAANNISHCSMVSTQLQRLLSDWQPLPRLEAVLLGGGPCPPELLSQGLEAGLPLFPTYGMSEAASQIVTSLADKTHRVLDGIELAFSEQKEILLRGDNLFLGYWSPTGVESATDEHNWFHTRDLGEWRHHRLHILGRMDNQFVSGGKNIQPEEIERILRNHPQVTDVVVVPVAHPEFGKTPFAFVALHQGTPNPAFKTHVIDWLKQQLPGYLVPRYYAPLLHERGLKCSRSRLAQEAARWMKT